MTKPSPTVSSSRPRVPGVRSNREPDKPTNVCASTIVPTFLWVPCGQRKTPTRSASSACNRATRDRGLAGREERRAVVSRTERNRPDACGPSPSSRTRLRIGRELSRAGSVGARSPRNVTWGLNLRKGLESTRAPFASATLIGNHRRRTGSRCRRAAVILDRPNRADSIPKRREPDREPHRGAGHCAGVEPWPVWTPRP